jgi:hypothetical protein
MKVKVAVLIAVMTVSIAYVAVGWQLLYDGPRGADRHYQDGISMAEHPWFFAGFLVLVIVGGLVLQRITAAEEKGS